LTISYILPTIFNIFNPRSPENSSSKLTNIFDLIKHPARAILFIFGLIGSALTPSSKFDSWLPVILGALVFVLIFWIFLLAFTLNQFTQIIRLNKTPFLGALIFVFMLVFFRGLGEKGSLNEAVAPRYVMGTSLLIASFLVLILERENAKFKVRVPLSILLVVLACSLSGLKTGLEWLSVRSLQTTALYSCIESHGATPDSCLNVARPIEEGDSSDEATSSDLKELSKYLFELR